MQGREFWRGVVPLRGAQGRAGRGERVDEGAYLYVLYASSLCIDTCKRGKGGHEIGGRDRRLKKSNRELYTFPE